MDVRLSLLRLESYIREEDLKGYDPYDALRSPVLSFLTQASQTLRILAIQTLKHMPINIRPFLGVTKGLNPKGLGLFLSGYTKLFAVTHQEEYRHYARDIVGRLTALQSAGYHGACWGYNFNWQSRAFYLPAGTPTIVNSSFIGHALLDYARHTGDKSAESLAVSIAEFIVHDLKRKEEGDALCFSYSPLDTVFVHNANLLGASFLIRIAEITHTSMYESLAMKSLRYSMNYQDSHGAWPYAETSYQQWIDSFHTGFNIESILVFIKAGKAAQYKEQFERGALFYRDYFFLVDGAPKYYHNKTYPLDIHCAAEAVVVLTKLGKTYESLRNLVARWMIEHMQDKRGYFYFQKRSRYTNKIPYMRWSQAWAFHALTEILYAGCTEI